jgi:hypothetical protein
MTRSNVGRLGAHELVWRVLFVARCCGSSSRAPLIAEKQPFLRAGNKLFVLHAKKSCFLKGGKPAWTLSETAENSRFQPHQKKCSSPS